MWISNEGYTKMYNLDHAVSIQFKELSAEKWVIEVQMDNGNIFCPGMTKTLGEAQVLLMGLVKDFNNLRKRC